MMKLAAMSFVGVIAAAMIAPTYPQISGDVIKIGFIADIDGPGDEEPIKMAIADFGGSLNGKKIELLTADHQNKPDIAATKAREWIDQHGRDLLIGGTNSGAGLRNRSRKCNVCKMGDRRHTIAISAA